MARHSIVCEGLSKQYRIGADRGEMLLREALVRAITRPFRKPAEDELIWALRDVSLEVGEDEVEAVVLDDVNDDGGVSVHAWLLSVGVRCARVVRAHYAMVWRLYTLFFQKVHRSRLRWWRPSPTASSTLCHSPSG